MIRLDSEYLKRKTDAMIKILVILLQSALFINAYSDPENAFPALKSSWNSQGEEEVDTVGDLTIYR